MFERVVLLGMALASGVAVCSGALTPDQRAQANRINPLAQVPITGTIQDPSGAVVTDAEVVLRAAEGAPPQAAQIDYSGAFRFDGLAGGNYEVQVAHEGFKALSTPLRIGAHPPTSLRTKLALGDLRQEITVVNQAVQVNMDTTENLDTVQRQRRVLDDLPVSDQDYAGAASRFLHAAWVGTGGGTLVVDGTETSEKGVSASAIVEVKINHNPDSAEYSSPARGRIEIIPKLGTLDYQGVFNFLLRDHRLNARDAFAVTRSPEQRRIFEENLSGPAWSEQKASFLISLTLTREARTEIPAEVRLTRAVDSEGPGFSTAEPGHLPPCLATSSLAREAK